MSIQITRQSEHFATAPQVAAEDMQDIARQGYRTVINNRPDGEGGAEQPTSASLEQAAIQAGLTYIHQPVISGQLTPEQAAEFGAHLAAAPQPVLAFCRTGTRATNLYRMAMQSQADRDARQ